MESNSSSSFAITIPLNALQNHILQVLDEEERAWTEIEGHDTESIGHHITADSCTGPHGQRQQERRSHGAAMIEEARV